jgi:hypothetical protein
MEKQSTPIQRQDITRYHYLTSEIVEPPELYCNYNNNEGALYPAETRVANFLWHQRLTRCISFVHQERDTQIYHPAPLFAFPYYSFFLVEQQLRGGPFETSRHPQQ